MTLTALQNLNIVCNIYGSQNTFGYSLQCQNILIILSHKRYCVSICAFYGNIIQTLPYILLLELTMTITIKCADNHCNFVGIFLNVYCILCSL